MKWFFYNMYVDVVYAANVADPNVFVENVFSIFVLYKKNKGGNDYRP